MSWWQAIVLGTVQGLTEFFPISSSGHLLLAQELLGVDVESNLFLSVILHSGTLIAVVVVLWKSIVKMIIKRHDKLLYLLIATIPAALVGVFLSDQIDAVFYNRTYLPIFFMITAMVLLAVEIYAKKTKHQLVPMNWMSAAIMGMAQALAVVPGISRSGMTISAGIFCRNDREEIAKMSFIMSLPVIGGSLLLETIKLFQDTGAVAQTMQSTSAIAIILGIVAGFLTGVLAINVMLKSIRHANYKWFAVYLFVLALILILIK